MMYNEAHFVKWFATQVCCELDLVSEFVYVI